jgi:hypothetical protein
MRRVCCLCLLLLVCGAHPSRADEPITVVANLAFHSGFWVNLHHTLYAAAWARRPQSGSVRRDDPLPAGWSAQLTESERATWDAAIDYYDRNLADQNLLTSWPMTQIKRALAADDPASDALGSDLRHVLDRAAPIYRRHGWPLHDRANRAWLRDTVERLRSIEREVVTSHERLYGLPWFTSPVRVDVVWSGRAYTSLNPVTHATVSPAEGAGAVTGWGGVEMVLHEVCHELILPTRDALMEALGERQKQHGVLWHVVQFYMTGAALQQILRARGVGYTPYMYSTGLFDRAWSQYRKNVEANWMPYVRGEITRGQAIERTVAALPLP